MIDNKDNKALQRRATRVSEMSSDIEAAMAPEPASSGSACPSGLSPQVTGGKLISKVADRRALEIMAPAGNFECLHAAIQGGADSVYFGVEKLNMRSHSANNFKMTDLAEIVRICSEYNVKTYLTLNIALFGEDLEDMRRTLDAAKAAGITAVLANISDESIREAFRTFKGAEHRLERVANVKGVTYINDSKATNVNSCWYALQSMTTPVVLILGGKDKGNDYTEIEALVKEKVSALICMGVDNSKLHAFFDGKVPHIEDAGSMKEAVEAAYRLAKKGDTVLLSPCCASFDLFKSYEDRGTQFKEMVKSL